MRFVLLLIALAGFAQGCTCDSCGIIRHYYVPPTSPQNILNNLQISYLNQEIQEYDKLLADDFRFYFSDEARRLNPELPEFWTKAEDVAHTEAVFESPMITDIRISLQFGAAKPVTDPGREDWVVIEVSDTFLEVDFAPEAGEPDGLTLRVDGQKQEFYFRKDPNPPEAGSELWHLVEWRDLGTLRTGEGGPGGLVRATTWSSIKTLHE